MNCETYQDLVAAHVDGVLTAAEQQEVELHVHSCPRCQHLFTAEGRFHKALAARQLIRPVPTEVERRLRVALAAKRERQPAWWNRWATFLPFPRLAFGLVAVGLLLVLLFPRLYPSALEPAWFTQVTDYYQAVTAGQISLAYQITDPHELEAALNRSGELDFATQVLDLRPAGYQISGGQIVHSKGHPIALVLYQGKDGSILCLRQRGTAPPMPPGSKGKANKYVYTHAGYTVSLAQYTSHRCVLISRLPQELFVRRLARLPAA